ncbi:MAG: N-acetylneuraminate synthase family protein [Pseudomonadota bacterium]|nr:N-acetylneuraminate synthase family protein [Pseudomonadota bacterium]|tara:strand:+ start:1867 stop:3759 length:1893 start_codon:yes stop_codon:yes gene_type:complete
MIISNFNISSNKKVFVIAEIGMNHNGSYKNAITLIDRAVEIGADCVKFQMRDMEDLYSKDALNMTSGDLSTQYTINLLKKFQLNFSDYKNLAKYAKRKNIIFMCTPWDKKSVDKLEKINVPAYKLASADLTNIDLISYISKTKKPIILSTGMSAEKEIEISIKYLLSKKIKFALLHTNSTYPTPSKDINLNYIDRLVRKYNVPIGYSGHERGINSTLCAVAKGACIIERHITLDKSMEGPDHTASLDVDEFKHLIKSIRDLEIMLGSDGPRVISQGELINRENLSKSIFACKDIKLGQTITRKMIEIKSPGHGLSPQYESIIIGKKTTKPIEKGKAIFISDFKKTIKPKKNYKFSLKWAIPVRLHDTKKLLSLTNPNMIEFHMSYDDLNEEFSRYLNCNSKIDYIVHAPELFENDHLLNLCSENKSYRKLSIKNLQKVIDKTIELHKFFPKTSKPMIIINCGGYSKNDFLDIRSRNNLYDLLIESFSMLDHKKTLLLPQNMAPFPWHFGGQRYQNLFMDKSEIIKFSKKSKLYICHDISHSHMACNYFNWDHTAYTKDLARYVKHYHIADASGVDGEGIQIGEGTINFNSILKTIKSNNVNHSFIPEIWQGHKNNGEGFWVALKKLEKRL